MAPVIFLVAMNAFFINCETTRNPSLLSKPAAVAGDPNRRSGLFLQTIKRAFGVKTAMVLHEALKRCPDMLLVPGPSFLCRKISRSNGPLSRYTPILEQNSIDEAWLNMTGTEGLFTGPPEEAAQKLWMRLKIVRPLVFHWNREK